MLARCFLVDRHGRLRPLVDPPLRSLSGAQDLPTHHSLADSFPPFTQRPWHHRQRRLLRASTSHTAQERAYPLVTDRFSRRADMFAVAAENFTAAGTADILLNEYIPLWGCPVTLLSDDGQQFTS